MRRLVVLPAALGLLMPATASAEIVKAPTGESSSLTVAADQLKTFKKNKLTFTASGSAKKAGSNKLTLPYSLSRWDFTTREGDVAYFAKNTGFQLKHGKRKALAVHPRLVMDSAKSGYISMLIANERIKFFMVSGAAAQVSESGNVQQITGYKVRLTQAGANYVNKALHRKALKRFSQFGTLDVRLIRPPASAGVGGGGAGAGGGSGPGGGAAGQGDVPGGTATVQPGFIDLLPGGGGAISPLVPGGSYDFDGDGNPDLGTAVLPLTDADFDLTTKTGTISLGGGFVIDLPGAGGQLSIVNPEVVVGATDDASGLYADVNGVRLKIGDLDTDALDLNVADGTVVVKGLDVTVSGALKELLHGILGTDLVQSGAPLLKLDLSFPEL